MPTTSNAKALWVEGLGKRYRTQGEWSSRSRGMHEVVERGARLPYEFLRRRLGYSTTLQRNPVQEIWALRDLTFSLAQGEILGLLGHNGAGKSVLLKVLSRITPPTQGKATVRGRVGAMLEISAGFQRELTGRENVFLTGGILGMRRGEIRKRFDEIVAFSGVEGQLDIPVKRYSSGMVTRLAFSVSAHLESEIMFADEVLAVGDLEYRARCVRKIQELARSGRSIIFVSHDMTLVRSLCSRAILLRKGRLIMDGGPSEVIAEHLGDHTQPRSAPSGD